jgi:hypothetical protein
VILAAYLFPLAVRSTSLQWHSSERKEQARLQASALELENDTLNV